MQHLGHEVVTDQQAPHDVVVADPLFVGAYAGPAPVVVVDRPLRPTDLRAAIDHAMSMRTEGPPAQPSAPDRTDASSMFAHP